MSQNSSIEANLSNVVDLLNSLGYDNFSYITYQFAMPIIGVFGLILCSLSIWIFFTRKEFQIKMYDYHRFLVIIYWTHLALSIPYAFFFTPRYLPSINTYPWAALQCFYFTFSNFECHLAGIIGIGIILDRERNFSPLVKKYYTLEPRTNCLIFLAVSVLINLVCAFDFVPGFAGSYYYIDDKTGQKLVNTYYYPVFTNFAASYEGFISTLLVYVVRDLVTLIVGIVLNIISAVHLRNYYRKKRQNKKTLPTLPTNATPKETNETASTTTASNRTTNALHTNNNTTSSDDKNKHLEIKLLIMVLVLCCISTIERTVLLVCNVYGATGLINDLSLILGTLVDLILTIGPAIPFLCFIFSISILKTLC